MSSEYNGDAISENELYQAEQENWERQIDDQDNPNFDNDEGLFQDDELEEESDDNFIEDDEI